MRSPSFRLGIFRLFLACALQEAGIRSIRAGQSFAWVGMGTERPWYDQKNWDPTDSGVPGSEDVAVVAAYARGMKMARAKVIGAGGVRTLNLTSGGQMTVDSPFTIYESSSFEGFHGSPLDSPQPAQLGGRGPLFFMGDQNYIGNRVQMNTTVENFGSVVFGNLGMFFGYLGSIWNNRPGSLLELHYPVNEVAPPPGYGIRFTGIPQKLIGHDISLGFRWKTCICGQTTF